MTEAGIAANAVAFAIGVVRFRTAVLVMVFWTKSAMLLILLPSVEGWREVVINGLKIFRRIS